MNPLSERQTSSPQTLASTSPSQQATSSFELLSSLDLSKTLHRPVEPRPNCCDICGRYFNRYDNLERHRRTHLNEKLFDCEECGKSFSQKSHLKEHRTVHSGEHPFKCQICEHAFSRKGNLSRHMKTHEGRSTLPPSSLVTPTATLLSKVTPSSSGNILGSSLEVQDPEDTDALVEDTDSLGADNRNKSIISAFSRHHRRQHGDNNLDINSDNPFGCKACWRAFSQASNINRNKVHERIHIALKPYKCDLCPKSFSQRSHLKVHRRIHTGEKPFACPNCPFTFSRSDHLDRHMHTHQGEKRYHDLGSGNNGSSSSNSDQDAQGAQNLNINNDGQSTTTKSVSNGCSCSCKHNHGSSITNTDINSRSKNSNNASNNDNQRFPTEEDDEEEESSSDDECKTDKLLDCSLCWKAFSKRSHESMHKKIHHAVLPFKCNVCGKAFPLNGSLIRHKRTHMGEKRFRCDICSKTFSQMSHVKVHQLIHGGNRPYKCDDCGYAFRRPDHLLRHKQANAGKKRLSCRPHHAGNSPNSNNKSKEASYEQHATQANPHRVSRAMPEDAHTRLIKQQLGNPSDQPLNLVGTVPLNLHSSPVDMPYYNPVSLASTLVKVPLEQANISHPTTSLPLGISHHHANLSHHASFSHPSVAHSSGLSQHLNIPLHPNVAHSVNVPHHPSF